jgi:hypothetical protein
LALTAYSRGREAGKPDVDAAAHSSGKKKKKKDGGKDKSLAGAPTPVTMAGGGHGPRGDKRP